MGIRKQLRKFELKFDRSAEKVIWHHPILGYFLLFAVMPILVLACVCLFTMMITYPMALIFGWL